MKGNGKDDDCDGWMRCVCGEWRVSVKSERDASRPKRWMKREREREKERERERERELAAAACVGGWGVGGGRLRCAC